MSPCTTRRESQLTVIEGSIWAKVVPLFSILYNVAVPQLTLIPHLFTSAYTDPAPDSMSYIVPGEASLCHELPPLVVT